MRSLTVICADPHIHEMLTTVIKAPAAKIKRCTVHCMRQVHAYNAHDVDGGS